MSWPVPSELLFPVTSGGLAYSLDRERVEVTASASSIGFLSLSYGEAEGLPEILRPTVVIRRPWPWCQRLKSR